MPERNVAAGPHRLLEPEPRRQAFNRQIESEPQAPVAAIYVPEVGDALLQWHALALHGSGKDADDGELLGSSLRWFVDGVEVSYAACGGTRSHCDIQPPGGAWSLTDRSRTARPLTVRLQATDSDGEIHSDEVTDHRSCVTATRTACLPPSSRHAA